MARIVLDSSAFLGRVLRDDPTGYGQAAVRHAMRVGVAAPDIFWYEVHNVLLNKERLDRLSTTEMASAFTVFRALNLVFEPRRERETVELTRRHFDLKLTIYDAAFVIVANHRDLELATLDGTMRQVAKREGVPLFDPKNSPSHG